MLISGDEALAAFRMTLDGRRGLDLVRDAHRVLVQLPVGVGKSEWLRRIVLEAVLTMYQLVIVLCPTRRIVEESMSKLQAPKGLRVENIRSRPAKRCGPLLDTQWRAFEASSLGALGRVELCGACPKRAGCFWPTQYGEDLEGAQIVYATQAHLQVAPAFVSLLQAWTKAESALVLLDESTFVSMPRNRVITSTDLSRFHSAARDAAFDHDRNDRWPAYIEALQHASTIDLQDGDWRPPFIDFDWSVLVQSAGRDRFQEAFRFPAYDLKALAHSTIDSRRRADNGDIHFAAHPYLGDSIIFSATTDKRFAEFRLGGPMVAPFSGVQFRHPDTHWFNIASRIGTKRFFRSHAPQILDFFASLIAGYLARGKRPLLIAKKRFIRQCAAGLSRRLRELAVDITILVTGFTTKSLRDPRNIPLINYGTIGTNLFEEFDAAFCLTGFYVNEAIVNSCLQDIGRTDLQLPIVIETIGIPRRRRARVASPGDEFYDIAWQAQAALEQKEHNEVIQTVGRVRPFTRARDVITFQMAELPGVTYDKEFNTLAEARRFFGIASRSETHVATTAADIQRLRKAGLSQKATATAIGLSVRQVRRYEAKERRTSSV